LQVGGSDDDQSEPVAWQLALTAFVVPPALLATANSTDRLPAVEERSRLIVLAFSVFDHELTVPVVRVHR
jgi:hypothetical protein